VHNKFELALEISKEEDAAWFVNMINYLYLVENECIIAELTPEKVKERREKKDVTDTLLALQDRARKLLLKKGNKYSDLMVTALNYMLNGWNENFLYFPCGINFYSYLCTQKSTESHFTDVFGHHSS
jgi:hypothetical protein